MKPRLVRFSYFAWIVAPLVVYALYQAWGLPHIIFNYQYRGEKNGPSFRYIACSYVGPTGEFWRTAAGGKCPLVRFRKSNWSSEQ